MYLSNTERLRLGLIDYGSHVPDDVVAAAEQRLLDEAAEAEQRRLEAEAAAELERQQREAEAERQRLEAEAQQKLDDEAVLRQTPKRRRARTPAGQFIPDDPATPDVDEAFEPDPGTEPEAAEAEAVTPEPVPEPEPEPVAPESETEPVADEPVEGQ